MTEKEQQIAIEEFCGWRVDVAPSGGYYVCYHPNGTHGTSHYVLKESASKEIPNFLNDLNAIHEVEKCLRSEQKGVMIDNLCIIVTRDHDPELGPMTAITESFFANSKQRAEALLRTLGLWKD